MLSSCKAKPWSHNLIMQWCMCQLASTDCVGGERQSRFVADHRIVSVPVPRLGSGITVVRPPTHPDSLFRSQGTLSDLLRNPKPWSKLKSGRETFRRMAKWLQEPEFKRMSDLRMAGSSQELVDYMRAFLPSSAPTASWLLFTANLSSFATLPNLLGIHQLLRPL